MKYLCFSLVLVLYAGYASGQELCKAKPVPADGYNLTGIKRSPQPDGCVVYWVEYTVSSARLCVANRTNRTIHVTRSGLTWRTSKPEWKNYYVQPGETKTKTLNTQVWIRNPDRYVPPKPVARVSWKFHQ